MTCLPAKRESEGSFDSTVDYALGYPKGYHSRVVHKLANLTLRVKSAGQ